MLYNFVI